MSIQRTIKKLTLIILAYSTLSACSLTPVTFESLDHDINQWLTQNEYDKIDHALASIDKNDHRYESILSKKLTIYTKKNNYIKNEIRRAKKYKLEHQWQQALDIYNNALKKIKNEPRLKKEKKSLLLKREKKVAALQKTLLMKRATALISYKKIYEKLGKLTPKNKKTQTDITRYHGERLKVARKLEECGNQANRSKHFTLARDCYYLSNTLEPSNQKQVWVTLLSKRLKNKYAQKRHDELLAAYKRAYASHKYTKAQLHLQTLLAINPSHTKAKDLLDALNKEINKQALIKIADGKELYSKKKINDALKVWQQALRLAPGNKELVQLISRAEKVSKKIKSLQKSQ